jgi:hypothetical protein
MEIAVQPNLNYTLSTLINLTDYTLFKFVLES